MVSSTCNRQWNSNATFPFYLVEFHPKIQSGNNKNRVTRDTQNMEEEPSSLFFVSQKIKKKRGDNEWLLIITSSCTYGLNIVHRNSAVSALFVGLPSHTAYCSSCGNTHQKKKKKEKKTKQQGKQLVRWRPFGKGIRPNVANLTNDAITSSAIETAAKQLKSWRSIVKDHKSLVLFFLTSIPIHRMANQTTPRQLIKLGNIKTRQADQCHLHQSEKGGGGDAWANSRIDPTCVSSIFFHLILHLKEKRPFPWLASQYTGGAEG